jgi:hypothetical protein
MSIDHRWSITVAQPEIGECLLFAVGQQIAVSPLSGQLRPEHTLSQGDIAIRWEVMGGELTCFKGVEPAS